MSESVREKFMMQIGDKQYLPVAARVIEFRRKHGFAFSIETELVTIPVPTKKKDVKTKTTYLEWVDTPHMKATISQIVRHSNKGYAQLVPVSSGTKRIVDKSGPAGNFPVENAETGAIGRALACLGFGTEEVFGTDEDLADAPQ